LRVALYPQLVSTVNKHLGFELLDVATMTLKKAKSILDSLRCNSFHGLDHPDVDEKTLKILKKSRYSYVYKLMLLDDLVRSIASSKLLKEFSEFIQAADNKRHDAPKYVFYSAHDTNLEILMSVFLDEKHIDEGEHYNIIPFSSMMSFELHQENEVVDSENGPELKVVKYLKILFNDEPQYIKWCGDYKCSLDKFYKIVDHHVMPSLEEFCSLGQIIASTEATVAPAGSPSVSRCVEDMICEEI